MDNLTHTFTGIAIARLGIERRVHGATLTLALACNLPDIDIVTGLFGADAYLEHHRGITHAFPASPLLAAGLALVLSRWPRRDPGRQERRFLPTFLVAWLGVVLHIIEDLWTSYGTRALLPFDTTWYAWDWIFIVDPGLLLLLLFASFGAQWTKRPKLQTGAFALSAGYVLLRMLVHAQAEGQARSYAGSEFTVVRAFPSPLDLNHWRFLAKSDDAIARGVVQAVGTRREKEILIRTPEDALVNRVIAESHAARTFLSFSAFPHLEIRREGGFTTLIWRDLRFASPQRDGFLCRVTVDATGRIVEERIVL